MNSLVRSWRRSIQRPKYDGPDAVTVDGEKVVVDMPKQKRSTPLNRTHFDNTITMIKSSPLDRVLQMKTVTYNALKRLGEKRDTSMVVDKNPKGSTQFDTGSFIAWVNGVLPVPKKPGKGAADDVRQAYRDAMQCIDQLLAIDATLCDRTK